MSNLKLITTKRFGELNCNFYRNMNDDILLTREQIGTALEYVYPEDALSKIHTRHKDRLDALSVVAKLASTDGKEYDTILYSQRGIMEICRWSNKPKANQFMDWVWTIVEKYRSGELSDTQNMQPILDSFHSFTETVNSTLLSINERITNLEAQQSTIQKQIPKKRFSTWTSRMFPKYQLLMDYFDISRKELYHNLYIEFQNMYPDIDLHQEQDDYCFENGLDSCFTLDVIEHNRKLRTLFTTMVNNLLEKYNLAAQPESVGRQSTIFDEF